MIDKAWLAITEEERTLIVDALSRTHEADRPSTAELDPLLNRLRSAPILPQVTIGVHGGQVQWTLGNPFPIRVCDYDGDADELPDIDERGQRCRIWFEPTDVSAA